MKIEVEIPDSAVPFMEVEAKARGVSLAQLIVMKVFSAGNIVKKDWDAAPPEKPTDASSTT